MKPRLELIRSSEPMAVRKTHPRSVVIKRADFLDYEQKMRRRESMRLVAAICLGSVVAGFMVAAMIALLSATLP